MRLARMPTPWRREVQGLVPDVKVHQRTAKVDAVLELMEAGHCQFLRTACALSGRMRREF